MLFSQFCSSDGEPVSGYLVSHSDEDGEWEEVETDMDMFKLRVLKDTIPLGSPRPILLKAVT